MMESILYIGTDKGIVTARSRDNATWQIADRGLRKWEVTEIAVSPLSLNRIFAGTRGDGVWVSEDFGATWIKPCYGRRGPGKVRSVTIDPREPKRIYAGCEPIDVFVSEDEGKNWRRLDSVRALPFIDGITYPLARVEPHVRDVTVDPKNSDVLYVALQLGFIIKSIDRGVSWTLLDNNLDCDVHVVLVDPKDSRRLTVATGGHGARRGEAPGRALYASEDAGASWMPTAMNFAQDYCVPLVRDPHNSSRIYSALASGTAGRWHKRESGAEAIIVRSQDGGKSWQGIGAGIDGREFPETIVADAQHPGRVHTGCRNGDFYTSDDAGDSWRRLDLGLKIDDLSSLTLGHT